MDNTILQHNNILLCKNSINDVKQREDYFVEMLSVITLSALAPVQLRLFQLAGLQ
jgi:hypothetical protein